MRLADHLANLPPVDPELGPRVRARREELGWTRQQLADQAGIVPVYVKKIEAGERQPSLKVRVRLGAVLGISLALNSYSPADEVPAPADVHHHEELVASLPLPRQPSLGPSPTTLSPGAVVQGHTIGYWLAYDAAARAAAEPPPRRPAGPPF